MDVPDTGAMTPGLALVVSLLRFVTEEAPHLVGDLRTVVEAWAERHPAEPALGYLLEQLDPEAAASRRQSRRASERATAVYAEVDRVVRSHESRTEH